MMKKTIRNFCDIAFSDQVKAVQSEMGSRKAYARMENREFNRELSARELAFLATRDSLYLATVNSDGAPYIQFRGGPVGFVKILSSSRIGFMDFSGNRQYISTGNLSSHRQVCLFFMDYANQARLKVWAKAEVVSIAQLQEQNLYSVLKDPEYPAKEERAFIFDIQAFDWNCPKHIPQRYTLAEISTFLGLDGTKGFDEIKQMLRGQTITDK